MDLQETTLVQNNFPIIPLQWFASAEDEGRTEKPSETKLRKAREEGKSKEEAAAISRIIGKGK